MVSTSRTGEEIGDSDANRLSPVRRSLDKIEQTVAMPQGSPRSPRSDCSTQSAASVDLAGGLMASDAAYTAAGKNGEKNHNDEKMPLEFSEKLNATLNTTMSDTLSTISKAESEKLSYVDKESVVSSASRISSLSQKILQQHDQHSRKSSTDKDFVVSSASQISSLSQKMLQQATNDDNKSDDSILLSAQLIASLSQKILEKQNGKGGSHDDMDSVVSSAALITSLSQRILQSRRSDPNTPAVAKSRPSFKSHSSRTSGTSFDKVDEITSADRESVTSSVSQVSSVSQRIKALESNTASLATAPSPRSSFNSTLSQGQNQNRSSFSKVASTTIDRNSMSRIQERVRAMQQAESKTPQQRLRPTFPKRGSSNPQEAFRPISPAAPYSSSQQQQQAPQSALPTETVKAVSSENNLSEMTMDEDGATGATSPQIELTLENVSESSALPDPEFPPTLHRFLPPESSSSAASKARSHVSLPTPSAPALDAMRQYSTRTSRTAPISRLDGPNGALDWFPQEHTASSLFPQHQFAVNDFNQIAESRSLPPMRVRAHSDGDIDEAKALDTHGFPKFLETQRTSTDKVPHHIQFSSDEFSLEEGEERRRADSPNVTERESSWLALGRELLKYDWKDKVPIIMGCLLILIGIIVGIVVAVSGSGDEFANFDLDTAPSAQLCHYVQKGYSIPGEEKLFEVDLNWLLDVSLEESLSSSQLTSQVQQLFQTHVIPTLVGCYDGGDNLLKGQYLVANGYAWRVREVGNCEVGSLMPCTRLMVSFVLWTKAYRNVEDMNGFATSNFGMSSLVNPLEQGYNIREVTLVSMKV